MQYIAANNDSYFFIDSVVICFCLLLPFSHVVTSFFPLYPRLFHRLFLFLFLFLFSQLGVHLSVGRRHTVFPKAGWSRKRSFARFHIDVFIHVDELKVDGKPHIRFNALGKMHSQHRSASGASAAAVADAADWTRVFDWSATRPQPISSSAPLATTS